MHLNIEHRTRYTYPNEVDYTIQQLRLTPQDGFGQRVKNWTLRVSGSARPCADAFGNLTHTLVLDTPHQEIEITAYGEVETGLDIPPAPDALPLQVYLRTTPLTTVDAALAEFARRHAVPAGSLDEAAVVALLRAVHGQVRTQPAADAPVGATRAYADGSGGCQDQAHVFIACCRHLGVPARYVSGYCYNPAAGQMQNHAWADVWLEGAGWRSFDPALGCCVDGSHVRLASGLDDHDACPVNGVLRPQDNGEMNYSLHAHCLQQQ